MIPMLMFYTTVVGYSKAEAEFLKACLASKERKAVVDLEFEQGGSFRIFPDFYDQDGVDGLMSEYRRRMGYREFSQ